MDSNQGLPDAQLEAAIWYVKHKTLLRRIVLGLIVVIDVVLVVYAGFGFGSDLFNLSNRKTQELELLRASVPAAAVVAGTRPQDLELGGVELLRSGEVIDVVVRVRNPNGQWYARFVYEIGLGEEKERVDGGFLLPGEERPFFHTLRGSGRGSTVFNIEDISWRRVGPPDIRDFNVYRDERLRFEVRNSKFIPAIAGTTGVSRAEFTIENQSGFSYAEPKFLVFLYRGTRLIGIQSTVVPNFQSGDERSVEVSWFDQIGGVSHLEVAPAIDILDNGVYLKPPAM